MIRTYITYREIIEFIVKMQRLEGDIKADSFLGRLALAFKSANLAKVGLEIKVVEDNKELDTYHNAY